MDTIKDKFTFDIVVACDNVGGIGKGNGIPWFIKADLQHFKSITCSTVHTHVVIMGRKTWESIGKPLPQRLNIVITSNPRLYSNQHANTLFLPSLQHAFTLLQNARDDGDQGKVFVIGGSSLYNEAITMKHCKRIYLTHVYGTYDCDTFFPIDELSNNYTLTSESMTATPITEYGFKYKFVEFVRNIGV